MLTRLPLSPPRAYVGEGSPATAGRVRAVRSAVGDARSHPRFARALIRPSGTFSQLRWAKGLLLAFLSYVILLGAPALAQQKPYLPRKDSYNVFVLGDSLAGGLGAGMTRLAQNDPEIVMDGRFKEDSGLARPEFYDWNEA